MMAAGFVIDAYLVVIKIMGHAIGNRPLLVLGTLLIIVGIQLLSLGLLSELIAHGRAREGLDEYEIEQVVESEQATGGASEQAATGDR
jgi:hypothetical protein